MCMQSVVQMVLGRPAIESSLDWDLFLFFIGEFLYIGQLFNSITSSWECPADQFLLYSHPSSLLNVLLA